MPQYFYNMYYHLCLHRLHSYCFPILEDASPKASTDTARLSVDILCVFVLPQLGHLGCFNASSSRCLCNCICHCFLLASRTCSYSATLLDAVCTSCSACSTEPFVRTSAPIPATTQNRDIRTKNPREPCSLLEKDQANIIIQNIDQITHSIFPLISDFLWSSNCLTKISFRRCASSKSC